MNSDFSVREQALDPSRSFIVEAPAGSGKTGLLVQRFLRLLSVVERPESIVAMTFTRKAAAEMRERIFTALLEAQAGTLVAGSYDERTRQLAADALAQDRKKGWNLSADPGRLQIQTIDSMCATLTRQMPVISEFGGVGELVEDARTLYRTAARRALRDLAEGSDEDQALFRRVSLYFDGDLSAVERQIVRMLEQRDQWKFLSAEAATGVVADFCLLLARSHASLRNVFRDNAAVDFTELTRSAIQALGSPEHPSDLLYSLDYRIEHFLVDEFQDTSCAQYDLIDALTAQWSAGDDHTLFVVGDPMQSIYRFRGAEVSLFLNSWAARRLGSVSLTPLSLTTNFRSTPEILDWVKQSFGPIMSADQGGDVEFRESLPDRSAANAPPELIALIDDTGSNEADAVVSLVRRAQDRGTVAILVRSRTHVIEILPALRRAGIPYEAVDIDELREQQHVLDVESLCRALQHPADRVAWLACLRAPWCGLTLEDLAALAENEPDRILFDLLSDSDKLSQLRPDAITRAARFHEIMSEAITHVGRVPLRDLVEQTWFDLGGPATLHEPHQREDVDTYLDLLASLDQGGIVRDIGILNDRLESLYAKPASGQQRVQVMTIFQAKGLEFDTVILPRLGAITRPTERDLLVWTEEIEAGREPAFSIAAQPRRGEEEAEYKRICDQLKQKEEHELKRIFYVACTRARNQLFLLGNVATKQNGTACSDPRSGTFLKLIWQTAKPHFDQALRRKSSQLKLVPSQELQKTVLRRLPAEWRRPHFSPSVTWHPPLKAAAASARRVTYEWVGNTSRHVGTVVHSLLRRIAREGVDAWSPDRVHALSAWIETELLRFGVAQSSQRTATVQVIQALQNALDSERGRWILAAHAGARSEWSISGRIQDQLITGTIDRLFRDDDGRLWIVDFKTSTHSGGATERFLDEEQRRYRSQLENYATLIARLEPGPIWLGLYFPLLDAWREWQLSAESTLVATYTGE